MPSHEILSKLTLFLLRKKIHMALAVAGVFGLGYLLFEGLPLQKRVQSPSLEEMLSAEDSALFQKGLQAIRRQPKKMQIYGGMAARRLLEEGKNEQAVYFLKQAPSLLPDRFSEFVEISGKIAGDKIKKALVDAYRLKVKMEAGKENASVIYPLTLLRISLLEKRLGHTEKEQQVLEELEKFLKQKSHGNLASMALSKTENPTLIEYVAFRKKQLAYQ